MYRKSDTRKKGHTRGWELILSYDFATGITSGFYKGTQNSEIVECIKNLKACISDVSHPLLLPLIVYSQEASFKTDNIQREARDWLRRLEHAIALYSETGEGGVYASQGIVDLDAINRDMLQCHRKILIKRPVAYLGILQSLKDAALAFGAEALVLSQDPNIQNIHGKAMSRLEFYRKRWQGIETYANTSLQRLEVQRNSVGPMIKITISAISLTNFEAL